MLTNDQTFLDEFDKKTWNVAELSAESAKLENQIKKNLKGLGYGR